MSKKEIHNTKGMFLHDQLPKKTWYTGIADSEGIESFVPESDVDGQEKAMWEIRAHANQQRFAITYRAELDEETATNVMRHLKEHNWVNALKAMSSGAKNNDLLVETSNKKYWSIITDHRTSKQLRWASGAE